MNHNKVQRLWRKEGLRVPQLRRCKRLGTSTGAIDQPLTGHTDTVTRVVLGQLPTGRTVLALASDDHTVRLWWGQQIVLDDLWLLIG